MADHIEWIEATERPLGYTAADLAELDVTGNERCDIGLRMGQSDGAMLYGQTNDVITWLEQALLEVKRVIGIEKVRKMQAAKANIRNALSRDDDTDYGSIFEDKVQVIRNLNLDSLPGAHDGNPDPLNMEYCRGQVELLMDTTDWIADLRPEKEEVFFYIFGQELA